MQHSHKLHTNRLIVVCPYITNKFRVNFDKIVHLAKGNVLRELWQESFTVNGGISIQNVK